MMSTGETGLPIAERVLSHYPAPLAVAWRHVRRSSTKKEEHDHLLELLEITTLTLATALASQYRQNGGENDKVDVVLGQMEVASFGTWEAALSLLQVDSCVLRERSVGRRIAAELARKAAFPRQREAIRQIASILDEDPPDLATRINVLAVLRWAVSYRNELAHAKPSPSEEVCRARLAWLSPAVEEFLAALAFLEDIPLVFVQSLMIQEGQAICQSNSVVGWDLGRTLHSTPAFPGMVAGHLHWIDEPGTPALRLLPALFYGLCQHCTYEPRLFLLRKASMRSEEGTLSCAHIDYTCSVCGNRYRVTDPALRQSFLDLVRRPSVEEAEVEFIQPTVPISPDPAPPESEVPVSPIASPQERRPMINPNVDMFLTLYSQSERGNQRTRGLDEFCARTYIETRLDTELKPRILAGQVSLVILTGNAGDGKTAFIQQVEAEARRRKATGFVGSNYGASFNLNGRRYQTIYDGSEDEQGKPNRQRLQEFFADFAGDQRPSAPITKIIAINEGHLRSFVLCNPTFNWLGKQVHHALEYENYRTDSALLIINLNLRSVVDLDLDSQNSLFDHVLDRFLDAEFWQECQVCSAAEVCPIKFNVDSLSDPEYGPQARRRLKILYLITHLRRKQHVTVRDLRSSLSLILFNRDSCEDIHGEIADPASSAALRTRFYYNAAFGATPIDEDSHGEDRLIRLLCEVDVAPVANPRLDNLLNFTPPKAVGLFAQFGKRTTADAPALDELFQTATETGGQQTEAIWQYHAMMRRKYFFESVESACLEAGYPAWHELLPFKSLRRFIDLMRNPQQLELVRNDLVAAINRSEHIYDEAIAAEKLCVRTNIGRGVQVKAFNEFPRNDFTCQVPNIGEQSMFIEYAANVLNLVYRPDKERALEVSLDLFELLEKVRHGHVPGSKELRGFFLNLLMFKKQLTALPTQAIVLTEDEEVYYRLEKTGGMTLAVRKL